MGEGVRHNVPLRPPLDAVITNGARGAERLIEVKTTKEPDWGVLGTAIGRKVVEDVPFITGIDKYLGTSVTNKNMHLLKKMGSATAASGAAATPDVWYLDLGLGVAISPNMSLNEAPTNSGYSIVRNANSNCRAEASSGAIPASPRFGSRC